MATQVLMEMEQFFAALADGTRLRLLNLMQDGEVCVCFFAETLGTNNPKISRHLAYLRRANLVKVRRDGKWAHYSINKPSDPSLSRLLDELLSNLKDDKQLQKDRKKLAAVCCPPAEPVSIRRLKV